MSSRLINLRTAFIARRAVVAQLHSSPLQQQQHHASSFIFSFPCTYCISSQRRQFTQRANYLAAPSLFSSSSASTTNRDGGARFSTDPDNEDYVNDDQYEDDDMTTQQRGVSSSSLSAASGSFRRTEGTGILAPRSSRQPQRRSHDPKQQHDLAPDLMRTLNSFEIKSTADKSVPVGQSNLAQPKLLPQKGGRPIHPADVIEQRGKLTPLQMHRILATLQQPQMSGNGSWTVEKLAKEFDVDVNAIRAVSQHLSLPMVYHDDIVRTWHGVTTEPAAMMIDRALGKEVQPLPLFGGANIVRK